MDLEPHLRPVIGSEREPRSPDAEIARHAARQHGVVARRQLVELGIGNRAIDHRVARGRLHVLHRGVFAVGHRVLSSEAAWMAAVLAGGDAAVLSHQSAAALWGVRQSRSGRVPVTAPRHRRSRGRIALHQGQLPEDEVTTHRGIPVTTPARTLFDLAAVLTPNRLERAIDQAEVLRLTSPTSLEALVARHAGRRGTTALKRILDDHEIGRTITRSHLDGRFLAFLDARGLPRPQMNALIEVHGRRIEVDCLWCEPRLIAELDGFATHATRHAFERDRERDRELQAEGWRVVRITARQLEEDPDTIESQLRRLLRDTVSEP